MRAIWMAGAVGLCAGCAAEVTVRTTARLDAAEGFAIVFPGPITGRRGRDGFVAFRIDHARTADGARFEAAWFGFPEALDAGERRALMDRVTAGIEARAADRSASRTTSERGGAEIVDIVVDMADGTRGYHRVTYLSPRAMLQVSAVGPKSGAWEREVPAFWSSLALRAPPEP